jgi:imidazole glycerol-phosphate synthase subunit HisH
MVGIVNYGMGNLWSVKKKLDRIKIDSLISDSWKDLKDCDRLILPGVGHFSNAIAEIKRRDLWSYLDDEVVLNKKPILGICLGMQLMAKSSEEGDEAGFGWFDAEIIRFRINDKLKYKVPQIGWNQIIVKKDSHLFKGVDLETGFYFVHSFHIVCNDKSDILNETTYEYPFVSAVKKGNITGVQYHPEKSHEAGEVLFANFLSE